MSQEFADLDGPPVGEGQENGHDSSLRARMQRRAEELAAERTQKWPIPRFGEFLEVELRPLSWDLIRKIADHHARVKSSAQRELLTATDHLLRATVGFFDVSGDEEKPLPDETWQGLAVYAFPDLPQDGGPRMAMIRMCEAKQVMWLWNEWMEWQKEEQPEIDKALFEDFEKTR
jgi:hypothetical protein